jgi:hypothetical protein
VLLDDGKLAQEIHDGKLAQEIHVEGCTVNTTTLDAKKKSYPAHVPLINT